MPQLGDTTATRSRGIGLLDLVITLLGKLFTPKRETHFSPSANDPLPFPVTLAPPPRRDAANLLTALPSFFITIPLHFSQTTPATPQTPASGNSFTAPTPCLNHHTLTTRISFVMFFSV